MRRKALAKFFSKLIFMKGVNNGMRTPTCVQYTHWLVTARSLHSAASALVSSENSAKECCTNSCNFKILAGLVWVGQLPLPGPPLDPPLSLGTRLYIIVSTIDKNSSLNSEQQYHTNLNVCNTHTYA